MVRPSYRFFKSALPLSYKNIFDLDYNIYGNAVTLNSIRILYYNLITANGIEKF